MNKYSDSESDDESNNVEELSPNSIIKSKNNKHILTPKAIKNANKIKQNKSSSSNQNDKNDKDDLFEQIDFNDFNKFNEEDFVKINIHVFQRQARKHITIIENIPNDRFTNNDLINNFLVKLKNKISARATIKKQDDHYIIEVSGDKVNLIVPLVCEFMNCTSDDIVIHGCSF